MSRAATDGLWRGARRIIDILDANLSAELTEDLPAGLNLSAPASEDYYLLPDAAACVAHPGNKTPRCYVYFAGDETRMASTGGPATRRVRQRFDVGIAFYVLVASGDDDYADTWKTLTSKEREHRRVHALKGAAEDVMESLVRNSDDVLDVQFVRSRIRPPDNSSQPAVGTWAYTVWTVDQIINVDQQN